MTRDSEGQEVRCGDVISFSYGIPPVGVQAKIANVSGVLFAMTPGHKPEKCQLSELRRHVGYFYKIRSQIV